MGFWSTEEEVAGLSSIELLKGNRVNPEGKEPYSIANMEAKAHILINSPNDMQAYRDQYMIGFRRKYRESYSASRLSASGFLPEAATFTITNEAKYLAWINSSADPHADTVVSITISTLSPLIQARDYLQRTYGDSWNNNTNILTDSDINGLVGNWTLNSATDHESVGGAITITMGSSSGHSSQTIDTTYLVAPPLKAHILLYENNSSGDRWYVNLQDSRNVPSDVSDSMYYDISPIIPLKEDNVMHADEQACINIMEELGIGGRDMWDNLILTCPEDYVPPEDDPNQDCDESIKVPSTIDNAYIFTGIATDTDDSGVYAGLFLWFDSFIGIDGGAFTLSMENLATSYNFGATKTEHAGVIASTNRYTKTITSNIGLYATGLEEQEMTLQWQKSDTHYDEIIVTGFSQYWKVDRSGIGWEFSSRLQYDENNTNEGKIIPARLVLPLDLYNNMNYEYWVPVHETGMVLLAYTHETIKLKWWQTGIFKIVVIIFVTIVTWGGGAPTIALIMEMVLKAALAMMIGMFATALASLTDSEFLQAAIFFIAAVATIAISGGFNEASGFDNFLKMADQAVKAYNKVENMQVAQATIASKEELAELKKENEALLEEIKDMEGINAAIYVKDYNMDISGSTPGGILSPDAYFSQKLGDDLFDYEHLYDVNTVYEMKKNVKT